ncbi:MAG: biotin/lipoyl-containing protein, partial [Actinomycetota bacterium]
MSDIRDFKLPDLGEGLEEGEIVEWHVAVGDVIELNQPVASIETAKAVVEVPSPFAGTVVELSGEVGDTLEVGQVFVRVDVSDGAVAEDAAAAGADAAASGATAGAAAVTTGDDAAPGRGALDADEEPQPLVGYGQGRAGAPRARRRRGAAAEEGAGVA